MKKALCRHHPKNRHHRRFFVFLTIDETTILLHPSEENFMATVLTIGHTLKLALQVLDQNGNPMLTPVSFDAVPAWSNTTPATETLAVSGDGLSATGTPVAPGLDTVSVSFTIGGKPFSATLAVEVDPAVQVATSAIIIATVE
jgi:hypothetical protein